MTTEEHKARHRELHKALDELVADYIDTQAYPSAKGLIETTVMELIEWSHAQTISPVEPKR